MAKISIVVPVYNVQDYLEQCINSLISQTHTDIEIILVDDGSQDQCPQICDYYGGIDNRVKVIHQDNGGVVSARKAGVIAADGKYVGFVDGDDWVESDFFRYMHDIMEINNVSMIETGVIDAGQKGERFRRSIYDEGIYLGSDFTYNIMPTMIYTGDFFQYGITPYLWNKLFLRDKIEGCIESVDNKDVICEDVACVYPYLIKEKSVYISRRCFYHYRVNICSAKRGKNKNYFRMIKNNFEIIGKEVKKSKNREVLEKQCLYSMMYHYMWLTPWVLDSKGVLLEPFGGIGMEDRIILYGAGAVGISIYNYLIDKGFSYIIDWVDASFEEMDGIYPVHNPREIDYTQADKVIVSVLRFDAKEEIKNTLGELGVKNERIIWVQEKYIDKPELLLCQIKG